MSDIASIDFKKQFASDPDFATNFIIDNNGEQIRNMMRKYGLLGNEFWPGDIKDKLSALWNDGHFDDFLIYIDVPFNALADNYSADHLADLQDLHMAFDIYEPGDPVIVDMNYPILFRRMFDIQSGTLPVQVSSDSGQAPSDNSNHTSQEMGFKIPLVPKEFTPLLLLAILIIILIRL